MLDIDAHNVVVLFGSVRCKMKVMLPIGVLRQLIRFYGDRMEPILSRYLERTMNAFLNHQNRAEDALGASLDSNRSGAEADGPDHLRLIRDEFDQLKAKLDRLEAS